MPQYRTEAMKQYKAAKEAEATVNNARQLLSRSLWAYANARRPYGKRLDAKELRRLHDRAQGVMEEMEHVLDGLIYDAEQQISGAFVAPVNAPAVTQ